MNNSFLADKNIYLTPLREEDADGNYVHWLNDAEVCNYNSHHVFPYNKKMALEFIENTLTSKDRIVLAVRVKDNDLHIGNVSLQEIDWVSRSAEFAILLGNKQYWGKGFGKEAGSLLLRHGFTELNLHRIGCGTSAENVGMQKLALYLGMKEEGKKQGALYKHGKYLDIIEYGILAENYFRMVGKKEGENEH